MIDVTQQLEKVEYLKVYMIDHVIPRIADGKLYLTFQQWMKRYDGEMMKDVHLDEYTVGLNPLPLSMSTEINDVINFLEHWNRVMHNLLGISEQRMGILSYPPERSSWKTDFRLWETSMYGMQIADPPAMIKVKYPEEDKRNDPNYQFPCYKGIYFRYYIPNRKADPPLWILYRDFNMGIVACYNANNKRIDECIEAFLKVETNSLINLQHE